MLAIPYCIGWDLERRGSAPAPSITGRQPWGGPAPAGARAAWPQPPTPAHPGPPHPCLQVNVYSEGEPDHFKNLTVTHPEVKLHLGIDVLRSMHSIIVSDIFVMAHRCGCVRLQFAVVSAAPRCMGAWAHGLPWASSGCCSPAAPAALCRDGG